MKHFTLIFLAVITISLNAASATRIAVVNVESVFRNYYKSKIAEGAIKQQAEIYRTHLLKLNDQLHKLEQEFNIARDNSQNLAMTTESRQAAELLAKQKLQALQAHRVSMQTYAQDRNKKMREFELSRRREILKDITTVIAQRAKAGKYDLVIDAGGKTTSDLPATLYYAPQIDLTNEVTKQLNSTSTGIKK